LAGNDVTKGTRGEFFKGFIIAMKVDPRDVLGVGVPPQHQFEFEARITASNQITVTAPLLDYHDRGGDDELIDDYLDNANRDDMVVLEALGNQRQEMNKMKLNNKMQYILDFGKDVEFSAEVIMFHKGKLNGILTEEAMPIVCRVDALGQTMEHLIDKHGKPVIHEGSAIYLPSSPHYFCGCLYWRVADLAKDSRKSKLETRAQSTTAAETMMKGIRQQNRTKKT
jgi:hypothetical protein